MPVTVPRASQVSTGMDCHNMAHDEETEAQSGTAHHSHTAGGWWSWNLNSQSRALESMLTPLGYSRKSNDTGREGNYFGAHGRGPHPNMPRISGTLRILVQFLMEHFTTVFKRSADSEAVHPIVPVLFETKIESLYLFMSDYEVLFQPHSPQPPPTLLPSLP